MTDNQKYTIHKVGEFYEVFDKENKIIMFVSERKSSAELALTQLRKSGKIDERLSKGE